MLWITHPRPIINFRLLLVIGLLTGINLHVLGCSCIGSASVGGAFKQADFVATGTIRARTLISAATILKGAKKLPTLSVSDTSHLLYRYRYTVEVEEVYKGNKLRKIVEIFTGVGNGDCGVQFLVGSKYVIYANLQHTLIAHINGWQMNVPPFLATDRCTRTVEVNEAELAALRKMVPH
ncbi:MAG: hypothetical protein ACRYFX_14335 [Janthinobacterium lividum]